ncbi:PqqD family peptide modification chaperone [Sphingomonas sp.]|uniref:PqqD family peptide modification chaperone n=1 Tax=Sphingomonas sp. TaxID=28214 RepID=UPI001B0E68B8|nr:PqqD family peptide modification chaperone [Sphingomonas sp.]MBO9711572.1 PqqD family protein [Sphingomonas sp.]
MDIAPDAIIVRTSEALATEVDGEVVLIRIEDGVYFGLDQIGTEIWRRLAAPKQVSVLFEELREHFEGDSGRIEQETLAFLAELAENRLVLPA